MAIIVPWLLEREYARHRSLDPTLPAAFYEWRTRQLHEADRLARRDGAQVVRMVIHPVELEAWARRNRRTVVELARTTFANALWDAGIGRPRPISGWRRRTFTAPA